MSAPGQPPTPRSRGEGNAAATRAGTVPGGAADLGEQIIVTAGRRAPFTQLGDWVVLGDIDCQAKALYWALAMHVNQQRGDFTVWPSREALAEILGYSRPQSVDRYIDQLVELGAIDVYEQRVSGGLRGRHVYEIHQTPPPGYAGLISSADFHQARKARLAAEKAGKDAAHSVVRSSAQRGAPQRIPVVRPSASGSCAGAHTNQTKMKKTKKSDTKTSSAPSSAALPDGVPPKGEEGQESPATGQDAALGTHFPAKAPGDTPAQTVPSEAATTFLRTLPAPWRLAASVVVKATPAVAAALADGWTTMALREHLTRNPGGIRDHGRVLLHRLNDLPAPPRNSPACPRHPGARRRGDECGSCWADRQG
ncbi:helix-turn-helix domain-containing protein [Streptosporangium sp. OZ121]|uniref:helix-turn-helix domain-containing protein n=1 Tax=Streptosporangium sp. OZ121 TaxID=3444183 RepID=UPI003F7A4C1C